MSSIQYILHCINCQLPPFAAILQTLNDLVSIQVWHYLVEEACACVMAAKQIL